MSKSFRKLSNMCQFDYYIKQINMDSDDLPPPPSPLGYNNDDVMLDFPSPSKSRPPLIDAIGGKSEDKVLVSHTVSSGSVGGGATSGDDSDDDEFDFTDADAAIDKMLDDLQDFQMELGGDSLQDKRDEFKMLSPVKPEPPNITDQALDHLRFSMATINDTAEVDLDALLEDLCCMERDIKESNSAATLRRKGYNVTSNNFKAIDEEEKDRDIIQFMPSSPTKKFVSPVMVTHDIKERLENLQNELESKELTPEEQDARLKAEKMKIALEKMKAASFQKLFIKVYNSESRTTKTMMIDQTWCSRDVTEKMIQKDDVELDANWCLVEKLPELYMERILEDHEYVLQIVLDWARVTENMLVFINRRDKYLLFRNPQNFLLSDLHSSEDAKLAEKSKDILLNEFFKQDTTQIPLVEGVLWLRSGSTKWNKHFFALRASGIYYSPKGKAKSRDLTCLVKFEMTNIYMGVGFKKKFKAPTDYVFCIKHPKIQTIKSKHIFCLCADDNKTLYQWVVGCRMAKYGYNMYDDYLKTQASVENVLLAGSKSTLTSTGTSATASSLSGGTVSSTSNGNLTSSEKKVDKGKTTTRNALKTGETDTKRVKGKQNSLGDIFSTAWTKGTFDQIPETNIPDTPKSPDTGFLKSPPPDLPTFNFANQALPHSEGNKGGGLREVKLDKVEVTPIPLSKKSSDKTAIDVSCRTNDFPSPPSEIDFPPPPPDSINVTDDENDSSLPLPLPPPPPDSIIDSNVDLIVPSSPASLNHICASPPPPPPPPPLGNKPGKKIPPPPPPLNKKPGRVAPSSISGKS